MDLVIILKLLDTQVQIGQTHLLTVLDINFILVIT